MSPKKVFKWSSHHPVIYSILEILNPEFILELGIGNYSSPLFLKSQAKKIIHIENDIDWINIIKTKYQFDERSEIIYHQLNGEVYNSTLRQSTPEVCLKESEEFYKNLNQRIITSNNIGKLLFVDHFACLRAMSINILGNSFDAIIFHDAETPQIYNYDELLSALKIKFDCYILKTPSSWTGFYIKKNLISNDNLKTIVYKYAEEFGKPFNIPLEAFSLEELK